MTGALLRTGSISIHHPLSNLPGLLKPAISLDRRNGAVFPPKTTLHRSTGSASYLRRCRSTSLSTFTVESDEKIENSHLLGVGDVGFPGDGSGRPRRHGGGGDGRSGIGEYYQRMLKANPGDPLLLRNYGKYLQDVEKDMERAEEYYGRAILADPGDGEVLCLYGELIWKTKRDGETAGSYFNQALRAAPHDWWVLGSYARFLWEEDEEVAAASMAGDCLLTS